MERIPLLTSDLTDVTTLKVATKKLIRKIPATRNRLRMFPSF